jgi:hypothetical protein
MITFKNVIYISLLRICNCSMYKNLMQVNWRYHQDKLGSPWQALDPYHNLRVGAEILQDCYTNRQDWWSSVGCYHSPANTQKAEQYIGRVLSKWQRLMHEG